MLLSQLAKVALIPSQDSRQYVKTDSGTSKGIKEPSISVTHLDTSREIISFSPNKYVYEQHFITWKHPLRLPRGFLEGSPGNNPATMSGSYFL